MNNYENNPVTARKMPDKFQSEHEHKRIKLASEITEDKEEEMLVIHQSKLNRQAESLHKSLLKRIEDKQFSMVEDIKAEEDLFESDSNRTVVANDMGQKENYKLDDDEESCIANEKPDDVPLHPVAELQRLMESNRQIAARNVLATLNEVASNEEDLRTILSFLSMLSFDIEYAVRVETVAQVPEIAAFCREHPSDLESVIKHQLVPLTIRHLTDEESQVRKASQSSLLALLEKGMVDECQLIERICPLVLRLIGHQNEEMKTEAVALLCKMVPLVGKDVTVKFFLEHIALFCSDPAFSIRQVCSMSFGEMCRVVGTEVTENTLLQKFLSLCEDCVWSVRKNCADVFIDVSSVVTRKTRNEVLPNTFLMLLCDDSRWVRLAAYQVLGAVIATFADPSKTGLQYCEDGTIIEIPVKNESSSVAERGSDEPSEISNEEKKLSDGIQNSHVDDVPSENNAWADNISEVKKYFITQVRKKNTDKIRHRRRGYLEVSSTELHKAAGDSENNNRNSNQKHRLYCDEEMTQDQIEMAAGDSVAAFGKQNEAHHVSDQTARSFTAKQKHHLDSHPLTVIAQDGHLRLHVENESSFNNFQFWRVPIPDLELDIDIKDGKATSIHIRAKVHDEKSDKICASDLSVQISANEDPPTDSVKMEPQTSVASEEKLAIQTTCMNMIMDHDFAKPESTACGRTAVIKSSFSEAASVILNQGELSVVEQMRSKTLPEGYDTIFWSRCRSGYADKSLLECSKSAYDQDIVPPKLLEFYTDMVDSIQSQTVDVEITQFCAHSFPAVVYTLGRAHWPCVKQLCDSLSKDIQWKVRKTIAACLHELAGMLGSEITARDLLPVFISFLKDLDEVRIGVLSHLAEFLMLLKPSERTELLPLTGEFIKMDNERNWRYRYALAQQLGPVVDLFSPTDVQTYIAPIGMWLITDKVSEVRLAAGKMMAVVLRRLSETPEAKMAIELITEIKSKFSNSQKWHVRQMCVVLSEQLALEKSFPREVYVKEVVPTLLNFTWDSVPNVRIAVARCLAQTLIPLDYIPSIQRTHGSLLSQVLSALKHDADRDVQYFTRATSLVFAVSPPDR